MIGYILNPPPWFPLVTAFVGFGIILWHFKIKNSNSIVSKDHTIIFMRCRKIDAIVNDARTYPIVIFTISTLFIDKQRNRGAVVLTEIPKKYNEQKSEIEFDTSAIDIVNNSPWPMYLVDINLEFTMINAIQNGDGISTGDVFHKEIYKYTLPVIYPSADKRITLYISNQSEKFVYVNVRKTAELKDNTGRSIGAAVIFPTTHSLFLYLK